ncbi:hypothetical protein Bca4012_041985 [Brassica carinata]|nr:unnamed protein product [Brassica napus]
MAAGDVVAKWIIERRRYKGGDDRFMMRRSSLEERKEDEIEGEEIETEHHNRALGMHQWRVRRWCELLSKKCKAYEKLNETCKKFMVRTIKRFKPADEVRGFFCF